jgi:hypothetical protein
MLIVKALPDQRHLSLRKTGLRFREAATRTGLTFLTQGLQRLHCRSYPGAAMTSAHLPSNAYTGLLI